MGENKTEVTVITKDTGGGEQNRRDSDDKGHRWGRTTEATVMTKDTGGGEQNRSDSDNKGHRWGGQQKRQ